MSLTIEQIVDNYLNIWWLTNETSPKTRMFWSWSESGLVIFDPSKVLGQLENAKQKIQDAKSLKKNILIVCVRSLYAEIIQNISQKNNYHYMTYKMPSGFLTNFETLSQRIQSMNEKRMFMETEWYKKITKKEQIVIKREVEKIEKLYVWVKKLTKKPDLVVIVDWNLMSSLVDETEKIKCDRIVITNSDFKKQINENDIITTNIQSYKAMDFVLNYILW